VIQLQIKKFKNFQPLLANFGQNWHPKGQQLAQPTGFLLWWVFGHLKNFLAHW